MTADKQAITGAVRESLSRHPLEGVTIRILEDEMRLKDDWWWVPVMPSKRLRKISPYYEVLAEVEEELDAEQGLNVLLVPALPDEDGA